MRTSRLPGLSVILMCLLIAGCASNPTAGFRENTEPKVIALRNSSGRVAQTFTVGEDRESVEMPRRVGGVAPAAVNRTYAFRRPPGAPPLPALVRVNYSFGRGQDHQTVLDLRPLAKKAVGDANEAVVIELKPDGSATAYLDHVAP
jgi:hypothetical protein